MVIPDKKLSAETLRKSGKELTPIGQLWLRKWTTVVEGEATPKEKLRVMRINIEDKVRPMPLFLLGVRKAGTELELVVYANDSEPLQIVPLKKIDVVPELPLEIEWKRGEKLVDTLTLTILGRYQASMAVTGLAD